MIRLGVLGSTRGTAMLAVHQAVVNKALPAVIQVVISNKEEALILKRAADLNLATRFVDARDTTRDDYDEKISAILQENHVDLIVLIGYMRILSRKFVETWHNKIINVHPSLLPAFSGKMDLAVHQAVLDAKHTETGCTVHVVTEKVDAGPILVQQRCEVKVDDTPEVLKARVQGLEGPAIVAAIKKMFSEVIVRT